MSTVKKIILGIVLALAIIVVAAAAVTQQKFGIILASGEIPYAAWTKPVTRAQVVVNVPLAEEFIKTHFIGDAPVPDWALGMALPHRAALLVAPDLSSNLMNLELLVNAKRLEPVILDYVNNTLVIPKPFDAWFQSKMARRKSGLLQMDGLADLDAEVARQVRAQWEGKSVSEALALEGSHVLEAVFDTRDGGAVAAAAAVAAAVAQVMGANLPPDSLKMAMGPLSTIASIRIQADPIDAEKWKVRVVVETPPEGGVLQAMMLKTMVDQYLPDALKQSPIPVEGTLAADGNKLIGEYTVSNVDRLIAMLG